MLHEGDRAPKCASRGQTGTRSALRALGIPRLAAPGALTMRRPNVPLGEFTSGRVDALLAVVDRWIKSVPAYSAELQAVCNAQAETVSP